MAVKFEIVRRVEGLFALADQLEARLAKALSLAHKSRTHFFAPMRSEALAVR